ncbi:tripartite tricarboxylate transporter substrate binding protein [Consotaella salsifontis]|uniref:Tripartite-type tricarboxylate transporter, receptor component TctC n=1 Tax=Consotaella salsifontis TaxID=1365950 RepID=A0A1T4MH46_9HYPH|nr:tripartite tricarboxylate transporter substrate binding protein [Consotaella salsifontis]SJZ66098.1 Tripartite-type tricarboxylate transporter, receptor component TctC [Consotaella salsifontis]
MKTTSRIAGALIGAVAANALLAADALADWPEQPVNLIVVAGAGGGSDYTMRLIARELETSGGQPINVINQAQGGGIVGYTTYTTAKPDGYTLGQLSPFAQFKILGQADFTADSFTPIALVNVDPSAIHVAADSKLQSLDDIVAALKKDPASLKISCGGTCSASWDIPFISLMMAEGIDVAKVNLIPAQGSAAGLQELASGGVDVVLCSVPETDALTAAGMVKTVAVLADERLKRYPDVPTAKELTGKDVTGGTWRGIAGPAGMDPALVSQIEGRIHQAYETESFQKGMSDRGFGTQYMGAEDFSAFLHQHEAQTKEVMNALGLGAGAGK